MLVGGSGLYVRAALDAMDFPGTDPRCAPSWKPSSPSSDRPHCTPGSPQSDPDAAAAILPGNGRRLVRALEVVALTGSFTARLPAPEAVYDVVFIGVDRPDLDARVAERTQRMWDAGFVDEVRALAADGFAKAVPLREHSVTPRFWGGSTGSCRARSPPRQRRCGRHADSSAGSDRGFVATAVSNGYRLMTARSYSPPQGSVPPS